MSRGFRAINGRPYKLLLLSDKIIGQVIYKLIKLTSFYYRKQTQTI